MQRNESVDVQVKHIINDFSQRIAELTTDLVVSHATVLQLKEENATLRRRIERMKEARVTVEPVDG